MSANPDLINLTGRVAVVTGAAQGIGAASAIAPARFGADVAICDTQADRLAATADVITSIGRSCLDSDLDVRDADAVEDFLGEVVSGLGPIDVPVNNAAGGFQADFSDVTERAEDVLISENFRTVTNLVRHGVDLMNDGGSIINVTSVGARHAAPGFAVCAAMKAAVEQFTKSLALELGGRGIRVNCVAPGMISAAGAAVAAESNTMTEGFCPTPLRRMGSPDECAAVIVFLASDMASFVTGTSVPVDGGTIAGGGWKIRTDGSFVL